MRRGHNGGGGDGRRSLAGTAAAWPPLGEPIQKPAAAVGTVLAPKRPARDTMYLPARRRGDERADAREAARGAGSRAPRGAGAAALCTAGLGLAGGAPRTFLKHFWHAGAGLSGRPRTARWWPCSRRIEHLLAHTKQDGPAVRSLGRAVASVGAWVAILHQTKASRRQVCFSEREHASGGAAQPPWRAQAPAQQRAPGWVQQPRCQIRPALPRDDAHRRQRV